MLALLFLVKGIAQQVEEKQRSLVTKRTADWCPYCGSWGWDFFKKAIEQNGDKAVYLAAHYSGGLQTQAGTDITANFGGGYQPRFFLDETDQIVTSSNGTAKLTDLSSQINTAALEAPIANCGFDNYFGNGLLTASAKIKFFQAAQGEFYLGTYLVEDNVTAYQASIGDDAVHRFLLRGSFTTESFGQLIANGDISAGQEFTQTFTMPLDEITGHDFEVLGIIWKKEGTTYLPINVWSTNEINETVSGIQNPAPENRLIVLPNVVTAQAHINVELKADLPMAVLEILDVNGRVLSTIYEGPLTKQQPLIAFNRNEIGSAGLHFIRLRSEELVVVEKVIFQ